MKKSGLMICLMSGLLALSGTVQASTGMHQGSRSKPSFSAIVDKNKVLTIIPRIQSYSDLVGKNLSYRHQVNKIEDAGCVDGYVRIKLAPKAPGGMKPLSPPLISKVASRHPVPLCTQKNH